MSKKYILLVDMNAFFISCEMARHKELVDVPAAVAGNPKNRTGIILTANYEARAFGVKTAMVLHEALRLCPHLKLISPDHNYYSQVSRQVMNILRNFSPLVEQNSIDEAWLDMTGSENIFGSPLNMAQMIMRNLREQLGLWCSIGISENKFLSKMAADMKKPLGITTLWKSDIQNKLWPLPIASMQGVGTQTAKKCYEIGIKTIGDLALSQQKTIAIKLGNRGIDLYQLANGLDDSTVIPQSKDDIKSIGRSMTLPKDLYNIEDAKIKLIHLADEVGMTARKNNKKGNTVQITLKYTNFEVITRQRCITATNATKHILTVGIELLEQNWNSSRPVRLIGITLSGFDHKSEFNQISMFDNPSTSLSCDENIELEKTIDEIRNKYGYDKVKRAILLDDF